MHPPRPFTPNGIISLTTDFGTEDGYVGAMKASMLTRFQDAKLVDIGHEVSPQDIRKGAYALLQAVPHFPRGSVHLAVIDPGVGSNRSCLVARFRNEDSDQIVVAPDNGLITLLLDHYATVDLFQFDHKDVGNPTPSRTFHGRDVFAPMAAMIAGGQIHVEKTLSRLKEAVLFDNLWHTGPQSIVGQYLCSDRFGNLITNIPFEALPHDQIQVEIGSLTVDHVIEHYAQAAHDEIVALEGSMGLLELAKNKGSAVGAISAAPGDEVRVLFTRQKSRWKPKKEG